MTRNPMKLLQMKEMLEQLKQNHPKMYPFFEAATAAIDEGTLISMEVTTAEGKTLRTNLRVTEKDMELIRQLKKNV